MLQAGELRGVLDADCLQAVGVHAEKARIVGVMEVARTCAALTA